MSAGVENDVDKVEKTDFTPAWDRNAIFLYNFII